MLGEHHRLESHPIADEGGGTIVRCHRLLLFNAARYCSRRSGRVESAIPYLAFSGEGGYSPWSSLGCGYGYLFYPRVSP